MSAPVTRLLAAGLIAAAGLALAGCAPETTPSVTDSGKATTEETPKVEESEKKKKKETVTHTLTEDDFALLAAALQAKVDECGGGFDYGGANEFSLVCAGDPADPDFTGKVDMQFARFHSASNGAEDTGPHMPAVGDQIYIKGTTTYWSDALWLDARPTYDDYGHPQTRKGTFATGALDLATGKVTNLQEKF